ncbi:MAG: MarR family transcriptional regulator [Rhizobium sp.]|nr:MarR family transcriptional regulator [Rhizobium sp.]
MPSDPTVDAWIALVRAQQKVLGAVEADLKAGGFPPLSWYDVLLELRRAQPDGLRPMDFEPRLLLAQHNVSRLLDRLEKAGLIRRAAHERDGRGQQIHITDAGLELQQRMWPVYGAAIERHVGKKLAGDDAADVLAQLLGQLLA